MLHKTLETKTSIQTDLGEFSALAATYQLDRVGDQIIPGAFAKSIEQWKASERNLPLHWDHEGSADSIIGYVNPASMVETKDGLYVEGRLDLEGSETAREAWRSMKNNAVALSFGYLATVQHKREDGVNELRELDVFEISVVAAPANPHTRFLSLKNASAVKVTYKTPPNAEVLIEQSEGNDEEPEGTNAQAEESQKANSAPQDSLERDSIDLAIKNAVEGLPSQPRVEEPKPEQLDAVELERLSYEAVLKAAQF